MTYMFKELLIYFLYLNKNKFLVIISPRQGWAIINLKVSYVINTHNSIQIYNNSKINKSYFSFLLLIFFGFYKNYLQFLQIKGMGYKIMRLNLNLIIKLGYSHRIMFFCQKGLNYTFITRQLLKLESRSLFHAKDLIMLFRILRKFNSYKKKGIFIKGFIFKSKISSKKSKV